MSKVYEASDILSSEMFGGTEKSSMNNIFVREFIKKALTPPTQEEVCKALSEYIFNKKVIYENGYFILINDSSVIPRETISLNWFYKAPHLITLIGRFYEGEIK